MRQQTPLSTRTKSNQSRPRDSRPPGPTDCPRARPQQGKRGASATRPTDSAGELGSRPTPLAGRSMPTDAARELSSRPATSEGSADDEPLQSGAWLTRPAVAAGGTRSSFERTENAHQRSANAPTPDGGQHQTQRTWPRADPCMNLTSGPHFQTPAHRCPTGASHPTLAFISLRERRQHPRRRRTAIDMRQQTPLNNRTGSSQSRPRDSRPPGPTDCPRARPQQSERGASATRPTDSAGELGSRPTPPAGRSMPTAAARELSSRPTTSEGSTNDDQSRAELGSRALQWPPAARAAHPREQRTPISAANAPTPDGGQHHPQHLGKVSTPA